ncbi:EPS15 (EH) domain-containing protein [Tieghemostelium lacteum]|uniref:EPS15 (EH) domain-containing protein n=1 Tax=Tieghemostelium lacteum TaxID=361077 RepID=A0A151Z4M8_TIELA|nr:EPS15 (EH) domain-containing protein [Tieghemostelium lacteum]|eukprot:KYQ88923.1 EPS15 (EH) domain-containing protein [Tieghemostelium lacteum]
MRAESQVPNVQRTYYESLFALADSDKDGKIGFQDAGFFTKSSLTLPILNDVWQLADQNGQRFLNIDDFIIALKLISLAQMGEAISLDSIRALSVIPPPKLIDIPPLKSDLTLTSNDKTHYIETFNKCDYDNDGYITGQQCVQIFSSSRLPPKTLSAIWQLADKDQDQKLDCQEFIIATYLINMVLAGYDLPQSLSESLLNQAQYISAAGVLSPKVPDWLVPPAERIIHEATFNKYQRNEYITGTQAKELFEKYNLPNQDLHQIWDLADYNRDTRLDKHKFVIAMYLINQRRKGKELPTVLPQILLESSKSTFQSTPVLGIQQSDSIKSPQDKYNINLNEITEQPPQPIQRQFTGTSTGSNPLNTSSSNLFNQGATSPLSNSNTVVQPPPIGLLSGQLSSDSFTKQDSYISPPPTSSHPKNRHSMMVGGHVHQQQPPPLISSVSSNNLVSSPVISSGTTTTTTNTTIATPSLPPSTASSSNLSQLMENISKIQQMVFDSDKEKQEMAEQIEKENQMSLKLAKDLEMENKHLNEIQSDIATETLVLNNRKQENQELKDKISNTRHEIKSSNIQLEQLLQSIKEKIEQFEENNEMLIELQNDLREKQSEVEKQKSEIDRLNHSIEQLKQQRLETKNELNSTKQIINDQKNQISQLNNEFKQLKQPSLQSPQQPTSPLSQQQTIVQQPQQQQQQSSSLSFSGFGNDDWSWSDSEVKPPTQQPPQPSVPQTKSLPNSPFDLVVNIPTQQPQQQNLNKSTLTSSSSSVGSTKQQPSQQQQQQQVQHHTSSPFDAMFSSAFQQNLSTSNSGANNTFGTSSFNSNSNFTFEPSFNFKDSKDPFTAESNSHNPFGEESSISSTKDLGSETLSEAQFINDKELPLFTEVNEAFKNSRDPFGPLSSGSTVKDSFFKIGSSVLELNGKKSSIDQQPSPIKSQNTDIQSPITTTTTTTTTTSSATTNNNTADDGFGDFTPFPTTFSSNNNNSIVGFEDSFDDNFNPQTVNQPITSSDTSFDMFTAFSSNNQQPNSNNPFGDKFDFSNSSFDSFAEQPPQQQQQ